MERMGNFNEETLDNSIHKYEEMDMEDIGVNTGVGGEGIRERKVGEEIKKKQNKNKD